MFRYGVLAGLACALLLSAPMAARDQRGSYRDPFAAYVESITRTLETYTAGDDQAVARWLRTRDGQDSLVALERAFPPTDPPKVPWTRARAAFLLEIASATPQTGRDRQRAIRIGRAMTLARPPLGGNAEDDRFETLWHQTALGLLQAASLYLEQDAYITALAPRYDDASRRGVALVSRFDLARAIAWAGMCCQRRSSSSIAIVKDFNHPRGWPTIDRTLAMFTRAAADAATRTEALVRGGVLLFDAGRPKDALAWLEGAPLDHDDRVVHYAQSFTLGRVHDALQQPDRAAQAYAAARTDEPSAQLPAIGLAAALLRSGDAEHAARIAGEARRLPEIAPDPWVTFQRADARFVPAWLAEIRRLRK
jgi:tetratricopeptide (TPR) repeat protein